MSPTKLLFACLVLAFSTLTSFAQKMDIGGYVGVSYYYGDVVNEPEPTTMRFGFGAFLRNRLNDRIALRLMGSYVQITGDDKLSESTFQQRRNWNFITDIFEGALLAELNLLEDRNRGRRFRNKTIPYVFGGLAIFYMMPKTTVVGYTSAPINQDIVSLGITSKPISNISFSVPVGVGVRHYIRNNMQIGIELNVRYSISSYLDGIDGNDKVEDVSRGFGITQYVQSKSLNGVGSPRGKMGGVSDIYMTAGVTLAYTLGGSGGGSGGRYGGRAMRCPRFY